MNSKLKKALESDPFFNGNLDDVHLDLSGFPEITQNEVTEPKPMKSFHGFRAKAADVEFAPLDTRGAGLGSKALKQFFSRPDREALAELSKSHPDLAQQITRTSGVGVFHCLEWTCTPRLKRGGWIVIAVSEDGRSVELDFTGDLTRDDVMSETAKRLEKLSNAPRQIPEAELIRLQRMAATGDTAAKDTALGQYISYRLPKHASRELANTDNIEAFLSRPEHQDLFREAVIQIWIWSHPAVQPTDELLEWFDTFIGGRVVTLPMLDAAWLQFADRHYQPGTEETEPETSLDDLSDEEISAVYLQAQQERARTLRT